MVNILKSFEKLKEGLSKTKKQFLDRFNQFLSGKEKISNAELEQLEEILLLSDVGFTTTEIILKRLKERVSKFNDINSSDFVELLKSELTSILKTVNIKDSKIDFNEMQLTDTQRPKIITVVGVNGTGKTTSIGKIAYNFKQNNYNVLIVSADTFRAAADEQLNIWAKRAGVEIFSSTNSKDPGAVVYEAISHAEKNLIDIVLIDTAGRLHTKTDLMNELSKINRVINKKLGRDSDEFLLIIDSTMGQNALNQIDNFLKYVPITGIVLTKLDGTAKGGVIFQIVNSYNIPVRFVGVGEGIEDLQPFQPESFVNALFNN